MLRNVNESIDMNNNVERPVTNITFEAIVRACTIAIEFVRSLDLVVFFSTDLPSFYV